MFLIALRMLLDRPSKSIGTLLGVVLSTFLMAQQVSTFLGILKLVVALSEGTAVDVWITSPTTVDTDITDSVPLRYRTVAASTVGVSSATSLVTGMTRATRPDGVPELVKLVGLESPQFIGAPPHLVGGDDVSVLAAPSRVLVNVADRPLYGGIERGQRIEVGGRTMIVAGFFEGVDPHGNYAYMFVPVADARAILGTPPDRATFIGVTIAPGIDPDLLAEKMRARLPDARVFTRDGLSTAESRNFLERTPVGLVFGMGTIVAGLVGSLVVGVTMFSAVVDRSRDFGTMLAIGARRRDLRRLLLAQVVVYFVVGTSVGLAAFGVVKAHAVDVPMLAPGWMLAAVAAASLSCCLLASLAAIRRVSGIDPAIVFRG
ncbi:MAG: FtsX-like permease family protein [Deltaproteobacteria bacterium]|nr:FtsX-like permease family protein [Nannocystaceae bacterium]